MPVYNSVAFVHEAVKSIIEQTFSDFELIVIDDGCTDDSINIVEAFNDPRIRILKNQRNSGIVYSRNKGNEAARGRYIAPFDSDDIARNDKFEKQIAFLEKNPSFGMLGSWANLIDENGKRLRKKWKLNAPPERIPAILLFRNYFVQSAVVIRREALPEGNYTPGYDVVEDYKMWIDIARYHKVWNYPDYLLEYRIHKKSVTQREKAMMDGRDTMIFKYVYQDLAIEQDSATLSLLADLKNNRPVGNYSKIELLEEFLIKVIDQNEKLGIYSKAELIKVIYNRFLKGLYNSRQFKFNLLTAMLRSSLHRRYIATLFTKRPV